MLVCLSEERKSTIGFEINFVRRMIRISEEKFQFIFEFNLKNFKAK